MINIEVVIIIIHPFEILQKGRVNRREVGLMTTILYDDERLAKEKARGLDTLPADLFISPH